MTDRHRWLLIILIVAALPLGAQDAFEPAPARPLPLGETLLSLPSSHIPTQGAWELKFAHRFNQSIDQGSFADQAHSLFGLDSNAEVMFGVSYTIRPDLQFSLARNNVNDTVEAAAKFSALRQEGTMPVTLALRGGIDWRTEKDLADRTSFFAQAILSHRFGPRTEVFLLPTLVTNAGRAVSGGKSVALFDHAFNVPVAVAFLLRPALTAVAEITPPNRDLGPDMDADFGWALGIKRQLGGHWFEILLTNSQSTLTDQAVTTTYQGTPFDAGSVHLGFNIERRFGRRR